MNEIINVPFVAENQEQDLIELSIKSLPLTWWAINNSDVGDSFKRLGNRISSWSFEVSLISEISENQYDFLTLVELAVDQNMIKNHKAFFGLLKYIDPSELKRRVTYLFKNKYSDISKPKKLEILDHVVDSLAVGIYSRSEISAKLIEKLKENGHDVKNRSLNAIIDRVQRGIYYFNKGLYVKVDEDLYGQQVLWDSFFNLVEELLQEKIIISTSLLKYTFSNIFKGSGVEVTSEYALHSMMKNRYKGEFIDFARTPIMTAKIKNKSSIDLFWKYILVQLAKEGAKTLNQYLSGLQTNHGFNEAYSRNMINEFGSKTKVDKQLYEINRNKEIIWI